MYIYIYILIGGENVDVWGDVILAKLIGTSNKFTKSKNVTASDATEVKTLTTSWLVNILLIIMVIIYG